ncbi:hypothetical protein COUCH_15560 [Couchioplanes caeruleus]|uniref:hypothetical protein n=1 Tax=Couchioplanes caeruleus TaxID=56438 RepID=UPI0020BF98D9|nr:hypothetical protein [Couchioplanes caeruleus]UQU67596.1 hypothetical protein COUCH_15560 [Couchioplanes caeruleus]
MVVNDSNPDPSAEKIFFLDRRCTVVRTVTYPSSARDPEDLAVAPDGTLWIADIGDNSPLSGGSGNRRATIALWSLAPGTTSPVIHRLAYPDGQPRDAETLLISGDGTPVIVTKEPAGQVYVPDGALRSRNRTAVKLKRVGAFSPTATGTPNPYGFFGAALITGGAVSPDGTKAVIRTMSDAYEFDVSAGDVAGAVTSDAYRITPLPNEPQGEAIAYTIDGSSYLTGSDQAGPSRILQYRPTRPAASVAASHAPPPDMRARSSAPAGRGLFTAGVAAGIVGALLIITAAIAIRRSRHH